MEKAEIVAVLENIAQLLELKGENPFKIRAYQNGARALETLDTDLGTVIGAGELGKVDGIGKALADKITTLHEEGSLRFYDDLLASVPDGLIEMLEIPGLGPKKIKKLHDELDIDTIDALRKACHDGSAAKLSGFGKKTAEKILNGIENREAYAARHHWWLAYEVAEPILKGLRALKDVVSAEHAGSLRRRMETVGDLDFLVASETPEPVMDWFTNLESVQEVTAKGRTKSSVRFQSGLQADLRIVPPDRFYFALHHFTGSKDHNVGMRQRALERGLSLSEWGIFDEDSKSEDNLSQRSPKIQVDSEEALFNALDLQWIPPELREDRGEIEAAQSKDLPQLITERCIKGVFHNHTTASDGRATLEEMVEAAQALGFEYLGIADHSKSSFQASGLDEERLLRQIETIHALNDSKKFKCHTFAGSEVDILKDGSLDFDDPILEKLDYVVASVHSAFSMDETAMTQRIIRAIENPHVTMLGHLTGRLLLRREAYAVNIPKVIDAAIENQTIIELNANPWRLDMDWRFWHRAAEHGLLCAINPDAHDTDQLEFFRAGVQVARKGWLSPENILNTRPLKEVQPYFKSKRLP